MKNLRKFGFEILIIFSGITLSFLFDEWRTNRNQVKRTTEIFRTIDGEITDYFKRGHRRLTRRDSLVDKYQSNSISEDGLADLIVYINADPSGWTKKLIILNQITKNESILNLNDLKITQSLGRISVYVDLMTSATEVKYDYLSNTFYGFIFNLGIVFDKKTGRFLADDNTFKRLLSDREFRRHMNTILVQVSEEDETLAMFDDELKKLQIEIRERIK